MNDVVRDLLLTNERCYHYQGYSTINVEFYF
jgi:hypothetical protein